ncbi:efflux RND transporter permease subunit, partial [bacterium]|nr:efflux RND transporter permease subunit [bacterium]
MRKITQFSVNYPVTVFMLVLGILLLGYISFEKLGIDLLPDLNSPRLYVEISAGEKPPEEIETQFVRDIEAMVSRQQKVTQVSSITKVGIGKVTVEYAWNADMDEAFLDLQKALSSYSQNSELDELNISQQDPNARPVMVLALSRPEADMVQLQQVAENYLENELVRLEGIASVDLIGGEEKEVVVESSPYLLEAYGLTATQVAAKIAAFNRDISSGSLVEMGVKYIIKGVSKYQNLDDIRNIIIRYQSPTTAGGTVTASRGGAEKIPVRLKDISKVSIASKDPENIVHVNQARCMGLAVYKETRFNTVQAARQIEENLERLKKSLPDYELTVISNQADFINDSISEVEETALIGILLAILVLFIFLRRVGVTFVISIAIPISIVATFNLMYFNGLTLNIMTLGGLALGAGMLVDNAIVVMENIFRLMEQGKSLKEAAIEGTAQVGGAITAATLTTIVVFLPIVYLHGAAGELFRDQAWTVAFALLSSLFVAILVIPMLSTRWLKKSTKPHKQTLEFNAYGRWLTA